MPLVKGIKYELMFLYRLRNNYTYIVLVLIPIKNELMKSVMILYLI